MVSIDGTPAIAKNWVVKLNSILVNRNTTAAGIAMILLAVMSILTAAFDGNASTIPNYQIAIAEIAAGVGFIFARDGGKSTAQGA